MNKVKPKPLKGYDIFSEVYNKGRSFSSGPAFAKIVFTSSDNHEQELRFGVSMAKKKAKKAVVRNRVRRILRESIRHCHKKYFNEEDRCPFSEIIIFWTRSHKKPSEISLWDVLPHVEAIFEKAIKFYNRKHGNK